MGKGSKNSRRRKSDPNARPVGQSFTSGAAQRRRRRHRERDNRRWRENAEDAAGDAQDETQEMIQEDLYEFPEEREPMEAKRRRRARGGWQARQRREWMEQQAVQQHEEPKRPKTAFSDRPTWSFSSRFGRKSRKSKTEEAPKVVSPRPGVYSGELKNISRKGFGFIVCRETWKDYGRDVFVYPEEVRNLREGDSIDFHVKLEEGAKGPRPIGYDLVGKERTVKVINDVKPPLSVFAKSEVPEPLGEPPRKEVPEPLGDPPRQEVKLHPRPKPSSAPKLSHLSAELSELQKRWRKMEEDRSTAGSASAPRSYHGIQRPSEPLVGPKGHEVSSSLPKTFPNVYGIQATPDTKKRNFDELFEKTKALLEKKEVKVAPSQANEARYRRKKPQAAPSFSPSTSRDPPSRRWTDGKSSEVVLLLDVVPNSAPLVQSVRDEILSRPGISKMHFAQPEGNLLAPWRAEILGASYRALEEVKTFLIDTLEFEAVRVVGFDKPNLEDESNLCVTVKGLQEAFGQGGACAALMACGRVLQWIKAGEEAFCWLASAEAVWVAQQFLHGATSSNGKESSVVPDAATQEAVNSWRERRRSALAKPRGAGGSWRRATEEELDIELLNDAGIQAAKARLEDFLCYVAEQDV